MYIIFFRIQTLEYSLKGLSRNIKTTNPSVQICVYPPGDEAVLDYRNRNAGRLKGHVAAASKRTFEKVVQHNLPQQRILNKLANKRAPNSRSLQQN